MVGPAAHSVQLGQKVRFKYHSPVRGWLTFEGEVVRWRACNEGVMGYLDVRCSDGIERSVRPNAVERI